MAGEHRARRSVPVLGGSAAPGDDRLNVNVNVHWRSSPVLGLAGLALLVAYLPAGLLVLARRRALSASLTTALGVVLSSAACAGVWPAGPVKVYPAERLAALSAPAGVPAPQAPEIVSASLRAAPPAEARAAPLALVRDQWYLERASSQTMPASQV